MNGTAGTRTILVLEDNGDVRALYSELLRSEGYRVLEASNGSVGMGLLLKDPAVVDVILNDLRMPLMDGLEFAETLKANERLSAIPIVLLSATPMANSWYARKYFSALLIKP
ncbi:response regulator [Herbaspirillum sp.]|uniref:response regulator n=1 Tax=Herbaspirillum sp. TaxID=1890675 RepID=UPI000C0ABF85|nr:response regulator [Herbaspirillum sp.]MAF02138.1 response regulator [Herbaspirillum sp.]MBO14400.1 response regulator [Herbaspirillum sp.]|tara:strand:- start:1917 stop:2252 length:336 start_codon:yes stop_codon:yes gene_type:complete